MAKNPFEMQITADGSPTLWDGLEQMHSRDGALAETEYVYGRAIDLCLEKNWPKSFLSLGLGLGYIELLIASKVDSPRILSFEKDEFLQENWRLWLEGKPSGLDEPLEKIIQLHKNPQLKKKLRDLYSSGHWTILGDALTDQNDEKYSTLLFDAFSQKASPGLWTNEFLENFLDRYAEDDCVFTTYAATGILKRILVKKGFELKKTKGFANKKESTFALREKAVESL